MSLVMRTEWAISVRAEPPVAENIFDTREDAEAALWAQGGELLMTRQVTDWFPA